MKVDLLLKNGWVYRTYRQCFEKMDIAVKGERFYDISPSSYYEAKALVDCTGNYIIPGLIDIHMHIESSMTYPAEFSRTVLPFGVTTVVADPHEIANVLGLEGIKSFMDQETDLDIFYGIPSCVPATNSGLETSGGEIGEEEVRELLKDERVVCLGEVMNDHDLITKEDTKLKQIVKLCRENSRFIRIEGHCPALTEEQLSAFIFEGVDADHTQQTPESVLEKTDKGMFLELQAKSLTEEVIKAVREHELYENVALVTDDTMPDHLVKGQLNRILELAIKGGMPAAKAIYCATFTPAKRMGFSDRGMIAPGKLADFVILKSLESFSPAAVYKNGKRSMEKPLDQKEGGNKAVFPDHFYQSVKCRLALASDFELNRCQIKEGFAEANVMQIQAFGTRAKHVKRQIPVREGILCWQEAGLCLLAVFERYGKNGNVSYGLVENAFTKPGAVATSWTHDSHNLLVLGTNAEDMVLAQNQVVHMQGGYVTASGGRVTASAPLPVGGIISDKRIEELSEELKRVREEIEALGYVNNNVIMSISTLTLLVSPELKLSDKGLVEVKTQKQLPLVERYGNHMDF